MRLILRKNVVAVTFRWCTLVSYILYQDRSTKLWILQKEKHKNSNQVIFDWCQFLDGYIAVSVCKRGLGMEKSTSLFALNPVVFRRGFQALMPFLSFWALESRFKYAPITGRSLDRLFLLLFIGIGRWWLKQFVTKDVQESGAKDLPLDHKRNTTSCGATSIDALTVWYPLPFKCIHRGGSLSDYGWTDTTFVLSVIR